MADEIDSNRVKQVDSAASVQPPVSFMGVASAVTYVSPQAELMNKFTSDNISQFLKNQEQEKKFEYRNATNTKLLVFALAVLVTIVLFGMIALLKDDNPDLLEKIVYSVLSFFAGLGSGFGISNRHKPKEATITD